jgi:hypothetical protein
MAHAKMSSRPRIAAAVSRSESNNLRSRPGIDRVGQLFWMALLVWTRSSGCRPRWPVRPHATYAKGLSLLQHWPVRACDLFRRHG